MMRIDAFNAERVQAVGAWRNLHTMVEKYEHEAQASEWAEFIHSLALRVCIALQIVAVQFGLLLYCSPSQAIAGQSTVEQAIAEYSEAMESSDRDLRLQKFSRSEMLFRQAVDEQEQVGAASTELLVNLGNAALQAEHIGSAIVAYQQALLQTPSHNQAAQNLQFARSTLPDGLRADNSTQLVDTLFFWRALYSSKQVAAIGSVCFFMAAICFSFSIARKSPLFRTIALLPLLIWAVLTASLTLPSANTTADAVVTMENTILYSADSENSAPRMSEPLPDGTEVRVLAQRDRWTEVQIAGRSGWVRSSVITLIEATP